MTTFCNSLFSAGSVNAKLILFFLGAYIVFEFQRESFAVNNKECKDPLVACYEDGCGIPSTECSAVQYDCVEQQRVEHKKCYTQSGKDCTTENVPCGAHLHYNAPANPLCNNNTCRGKSGPPDCIQVTFEPGCTGSGGEGGPMG